MNEMKSLLTSKELVKNAKGFSLIEILIGITLIGLITTVVGSKIFSMFEKGKRKTAIVQMGSIAAVLEQYRLDCQRYPTTEQGLDALINKPSGSPECKNYNSSGYLDAKTPPADPWDMPYEYVSDGATMDIISHGPNAGVEGGTGDKAPIKWSEVKGGGSGQGAESNPN